MHGDFRPYVVKQGDSLTKLAHARGFDAAETWNHPKNAELRAQRNPEALAPGDILHMPAQEPPSLPLQTGTVNRYRATVPRVTLRLRFRDGNGPLANEAWAIEGGATPAEGTTDEDGHTEIVTSPFVASLDVRFPRRGVSFRVFTGHLDPIEEESGVRARLIHLGYLPPPVSVLFGIDDPAAPFHKADDGERLTAAIRDFQAASGMEPTGRMDAETRDALLRAHKV